MPVPQHWRYNVQYQLATSQDIASTPQYQLGSKRSAAIPRISVVTSTGGSLNAAVPFLQTPLMPCNVIPLPLQGGAGILQLPAFAAQSMISPESASGPTSPTTGSDKSSHTLPDTVSGPVERPGKASCQLTTDPQELSQNKDAADTLQEIQQNSNLRALSNIRAAAAAIREELPFCTMPDSDIIQKEQPNSHESKTASRQQELQQRADAPQVVPPLSAIDKVASLLSSAIDAVDRMMPEDAAAEEQQPVPKNQSSRLPPHYPKADQPTMRKVELRPRTEYRAKRSWRGCPDAESKDKEQPRVHIPMFEKSIPVLERVLEEDSIDEQQFESPGGCETAGFLIPEALSAVKEETPADQSPASEGALSPTAGFTVQSGISMISSRGSSFAVPAAPAVPMEGNSTPPLMPLAPAPADAVFMGQLVKQAERLTAQILTDLNGVPAPAHQSVTEDSLNARCKMQADSPSKGRHDHVTVDQMSQCFWQLSRSASEKILSTSTKTSGASTPVAGLQRATSLQQLGPKIHQGQEVPSHPYLQQVEVSWRTSPTWQATSHLCPIAGRHRRTPRAGCRRRGELVIMLPTFRI